MKKFNEKSLVKGWFVGDFDPTCFRTQNAEVSLKRYKSGDKEDRHHHKIATEITFVVSGKIKMNGEVYEEGDVVVVDPKESTDFEALTESINVVVKTPGIQNDKYMGDSSS
jgi:quercetin dioxygenase-like cupin family protein